MKEIKMTEGVPTEDGWYVVKCKDINGEYYDICLVANKIDLRGTNIISYLKLPDL